MTFARTILAAAGVVLGLLYGTPTALGQQSNDAGSGVSEFWRTIQHAAASSDDLDASDHWGEIAQICFTALNQLEDGKNWRPQIRHFVNQFGRHGPQADFRWLITDPRLTVPVCAVEPNYGPDDRPSWRAEVADAICEDIVRRAVAEPEFLSRYYRAVLWTGEFLAPPRGDGSLRLATSFGAALSSTRDGFTKRPAVEYWWFARNAVLLFHATGRDDLLKDAQPTQLKQRFEKLDDWLKDNGRYLKADPNYPRWILDDKVKRLDIKWHDQYLPPFTMPPKPFDDWEGKSPPSRKLIHSIY